MSHFTNTTTTAYTKEEAITQSQSLYRQLFDCFNSTDAA